MQECFGGCVNDVEAAIVGECWADVEAIAASVGPGLALAGFVVDDYWATNWAEWCGVKVEGAVEVFPSGYGGGYGGLS